MTHRSGLAYGFMTPGPLGQELFSRFGMGIESPLAPDAWLVQLAELPLAYAPGERFNYGHSTDVLGFLPLGMIDTDFWIPPAKRSRMAHNYSSPALGQFARANIAQFTADEAAAYASGGQGLVSTAEDYLTFAKMLLNGGTVKGAQLLKPVTVELMTSNRLTAAQREIPFMGSPFFKARGFGFGVSVVTEPEHHVGAAGRGSFGWPGGFGGWWQADPENELVLLWLQECVPGSPIATTASPPRMPGARALIEFQRKAYAALAC
jgi:CubicO group peptidase (beta-lactamase class C family)